MSLCKASEIPRNPRTKARDLRDAYLKYAAVTRDEGNVADGRFPTASIESIPVFYPILIKITNEPVEKAFYHHYFLYYKLLESH